MVRLVVGLGVLAIIAHGAFAAATPLTTKEIGLMLRSGYPSQSVLQELSRRGCADIFDAEAEKQLVRAGASAELIDALQAGQYRVAAPAPPAKVSRSATPLPKSADTNISDGAPASDPAPPPPAADAIYSRIKGDLVYLHGGSIVPFDDDALEKKRFYLLFFGGNWNPIARKFTPELVDFYNQIAPAHPEFELIFFSADRSKFGMETYMTQAAMPWPAVDYNKLSGKAGDIQRGLVREIPALVLTDGAGKILSYSHGGDNPVGLEQVLTDAVRILTHGPDAVH
jgi:hypothetical protein